ncbi:MAG: mechanosensitive ion channel [Proteobacteria bacterium]|nr:mechanosensitive ion channel family protein [Pseudomonadota bacterium]NOG60665.1 mechanosensitive ion channel [Pseudomonadota bacterium]
MLENYFNSFINWFLQYELNVLLTTIIIIIYFIFRRIVNPKIEEYIDRDHLKNETLKSALFSVSIFSWLITLSFILFIWGFNFKSLLALSTGLLAVTGVALFANWSILSNVTAFFILLVHKSYKRGNFIRVIDLDNYIEGYIAEIGLFNTKLITVDRETIVFPNNLLIAKPSIINAKTRYNKVGKTEDFKSLNPEKNIPS